MLRNPAKCIFQIGFMTTLHKMMDYEHVKSQVILRKSQVILVYRPTITKVLEMFERSIDDLDMPPKQNFCETTVRCFSHISVPLFFPVKLLFSNNLTRALISHCSENSAHNLDVRSASSTRSEEISLASSENHTTTANSLSS
jgi:hypothetical protein